MIPERATAALTTSAEPTMMTISSLKPEWFRDGTVNIVVQEAVKGYPALNDKGIKLTVDYAKTEEQRQMLELLYSQEIFGRPYVMAPGVPKERLDAMRRAFMDTWQDPDLQAEAKPGRARHGVRHQRRRHDGHRGRWVDGGESLLRQASLGRLPGLELLTERGGRDGDVAAAVAGP